MKWTIASRLAAAVKDTVYRLWQSYEGMLSTQTPARTKSGAAVNWQTAMRVTTVLACARVLAEGVAQVPFKVYRGAHEEAREHPLFDLLHSRPNAWQTSFEFREQLMLHLVLCGNAYAFKNKFLGSVIELMLFEPQQVTPKRAADGTITYRVQLDNGSQQDFPAESIWHLRGPSWNGWVGLDAVHLAREAIGLALSTEEQHARLFSNGVSTSGTYSVEGTLSPQQYKDLRRFITENHAGANSGAPMILDRGAKWLNQAMSGVDAQHLETRRLQIEELCRAMRVMPIMVGHADKTATYASAEQMFLAHVVHSLSPWYGRIEQSAQANLLTAKERAAGHYVKFVEEGLLRGSMEATANMLDKYVNGGLMTPNEGRAKLDMKPDADPKSNQLRVPANIVGKQPTPEPQPGA